jgi:ABC-type polysaccharide/polyol phosphate transport system ATPase subunit
VSDVPVVFDHVSKKFRRGELHDSLRDLVPALTRNLLRRARPGELRRQEFWALDDVHFEVRAGEAFGIVGHNGAGKSTILKLLCGIMKPTMGQVNVKGRLSGLLEIGAGFHPDLTGRENIFLNGTILGMSRREIATKFDEIVEFSELADFLDTPVKRYSTGMYARLGFSVAAHLEPDVVIIDEVLSVGDSAFQRKSLEKMQSLARGGATVVFVSHNLKAVAELCHRCMILDHGKMATMGPTDEALQQYLNASGERRVGGESAVRATRLTIRGPEGPKVNFKSGDQAWVDVEIAAKEPVRDLSVGLTLSDQSFYVLYGTSIDRLGCELLTLDSGGTARVTFALDLHLARGTYHFRVDVYRPNLRISYDRWHQAASIVVGSDHDTIGSVDLGARVEIARPPSDRPSATAP